MRISLRKYRNTSSTIRKIFNLRSIDYHFLRMKSKVQGILGLVLCMLLLSSCHSSKSGMRSDDLYGVNMRQLARAGIALGVDVDETDDWPLLIETSQWLGTPYVYGGNKKSGTDCSGFTSQVFKKVYNIGLHRRAVDQYKKDCKTVHKSKLQMGDLVFFATGSSSSTVSHVGIYLKDNRFIHASSSRGVVVDNLTGNYYVKHWVNGGRVKN